MLKNYQALRQLEAVGVMPIRLSHSAINVVDSKPLTEFQDLFEELGYGMGLDEITEWLQSDVSDSGVH